MEERMSNESELTPGQITKLERAVALTDWQWQQAKALVQAKGVPETPSNLLAMTQIIATNYLAEYQRLAANKA
jgi:hypothetical protein